MICVLLLSALAVGVQSAPSAEMVPLQDMVPLSQNEKRELPMNRQGTSYNVPNDGNLYLIPFPKTNSRKKVYTWTASFTCPSATTIAMTCQFRLREGDTSSFMKTENSDASNTKEWYSFSSGQSPTLGTETWNAADNSFSLDFQYHQSGSNSGADAYIPAIDTNECVVGCVAGTTTQGPTTTAGPTTTGAPTTTAAPGSCPCVRDYTTCPNRIFNGRDTCPEVFPHQCAVYSSFGSFNCGCTVLNNEWILTAAHCTSRRGNFIGLGVTNRDTRDQYIAAADIINHPNYNSRRLTNDIALIRLATPVEFTSRIRPACLNQLAQTSLIGQSLTVSGLGRTNSNGGVPALNKETQLEVVSDNDCSFVSGYDANSFICVLDRDNDGTAENICSGDSGGPLTRFTSNQICVVGATSWGLSSSNCDDISVAGYSEVYNYIDWIGTTTGGDIVPEQGCSC